ncbi:MAG: hypothetical protein IJ229_02710, partial [Clostridia bacterium]|nr:hypothetical protein [Clostridia bacterium]
FLQCLLNGGMGYLSDTLQGEALEENIRQHKIISELQSHVGYEKMTGHRFLNEDRTQQETVFSDGTVVTVDFAAGTYTLHYPEDKA